MKQNKRWHAMRRKGIGGSDVHHVLGLPPYGCAAFLFDEKRGIPEDYPVLHSPHMERGKGLEAVVARLYAKKTGFRVSKDLTEIKSLKHPFMRGSIDRVVDAQWTGRIHMDEWRENAGILEVKCPGVNNFLKYRAEGLPESIILQAQWYLAICQELGLASWCDYAIFSAELWELEVFTVLADPLLMGLVIQCGEEFWRAVEYGPRPDRLPMGDERCPQCTRRKSCWQDKLALIERPDAGDGVPDLSGNEVAVSLIGEYREAKALKDGAEERMKKAKAGMALLMGDSKKIRAAGASVWLAQKSTIDMEAVYRDFPGAKDEKYKRVGAPYIVVK